MTTKSDKITLTSHLCET